MKNISVYLMLLGITLLAVSSALFLFMNNWLIAETICFVIGFLLIIIAGKIENKMVKK